MRKNLHMIDFQGENGNGTLIKFVGSIDEMRQHSKEEDIGVKINEESYLTKQER